MTRVQNLGLLGGLVVSTLLTVGADQPPAGSAAPVGKDGAPMVLIPEGPFPMGSNGGIGNERPVHTVSVPAYALDEFEVTTGSYAKYRQATGPSPPPTWDGDPVTVAADP